MPMMAAYLQVFTVGLLVTVFFSTAHGTALDDYVNKYDPTYTYTEIGTPFKGDGFTSYFINMTSQTWLSGELAALNVHPTSTCLLGAYVFVLCSF